LNTNDTIVDEVGDFVEHHFHILKRETIYAILVIRFIIRSIKS
jgi:hypothetical protein